MIIKAFNQKINGHQLYYHVEAEGVLPLQYAFVEKRNGLLINRTDFSDCADGILDMSEKGCYEIAVTVRNSERQSLHEVAPMIYHVPLMVHVCGDYFTKKWLISAQEKKIVHIGKVLNKVSAFLYLKRLKLHFNVESNNAVLVMDFVKLASSFAEKNFTFLNKIRTKTDRKEIAELRTNYLPLKKFLNEVRKSLSMALASYGKDNVFLLSPICDFFYADEKSLNLNWVLEEADYIALHMKGIKRLLMAHCIPQAETGALDAFEGDTKKAEETLHKAAIKKYVGVIGFPQLEVSLNDNKLHAHYISKLPAEACSIRLDLVRTDIRLDHQINPKEQSYTWILTEPGTYIVRVHVSYAGQRTYRQSLPVAYYPDKEMKEYRDFLSKDNKPDTRIGRGFIPLRDVPATMPDFLFLSWQTDKSDIIDQAKVSLKKVNESFSWIDLPDIGKWHCAVLTNGRLLNNHDEKLLFSGETVSRGKFIEGAGELPSDFTVEELLGGTGPFALIAHNGKRCILSRDFNNYFQQYYCKQDSLVLISPAYHLLLLAMTACGFKGTLDEKKAGVTLSVPATQMLMANFSCQMDIKEVLQVPVYKDLILTAEDGWKNVNNKFYEILNNKEPYHEELYRSLIKMTNKEIREYMYAAFTNPKCSNIILNLTGGIDSRYLFALITGMKLDKPLYIHSYPDGKGNIDDVRFATLVNSLYRFPFYQLPDISRIMECDKVDKWTRSEFLGRTAEYPITFTFGQPNTVALSHVEKDRYYLIGGGGVSLARPEYGKHCFKSMENREETTVNIAECYAERFSHNLFAGKEPFLYFYDYLVEELNAIPSDSVYECLETHFLMHKNALHFGTFIREKYHNMPILIPMQSPQMFRLKHMTYDRFRSMKMMFDLVADANPFLSVMPYIHEEYNLSYKNLSYSLITRHHDYQETSTEANEDLQAWEEANRKRAINRRSAQSEAEIEELTRQMGKLPEERYASLLYNSRELLKRCPELERNIGKALYHYIKMNRTDEIIILRLYNKVTSLLDQLRIFDTE